MNVDEAKIYEALLAQEPQVAEIAKQLSDALYDLCKISDTVGAYVLGERVRLLAIRWVSFCAQTAFRAGKQEAKL